jgi:hypothetical protein
MEMYEYHTQPLLPRSRFFIRFVYHTLVSLAIMSLALVIGILGYHFFEGLNWVDSLLNASMILGGMGPVDMIKSESGKIFASIYALFSGIVFLVVAGVIVAPVAHRILHFMHMEDANLKTRKH